jgi:hypothetical protein
MKKNTNTYKSILGLSAVAALIGTPAAVMANTVTLTQNPYSFGDAGEFTASGVSTTGLGYDVNSQLGIATASTFETFCVQTAVDFNAPGTYGYVTGSATGLTPSAENGSGGTSSNPQPGINLSEGTAYLYYEFATGGLNGSLNGETSASTYNYANTGNTRQNEAGELQIAIWYFMGELGNGNNLSLLPSGFTLPKGMSTILSDPFITLADNALGGTADAMAKNGNGNVASDLDYGVSIMQLTSDNGTVANQNQLILNGNGAPALVTVPDGGMTLAMLGMGLAGLFFVNFQRTKSVAKQN